MEDCIDAFERQSGIDVIPTEQLPEGRDRLVLSRYADSARYSTSSCS